MIVCPLIVCAHYLLKHYVPLRTGHRLFSKIGQIWLIAGFLFLIGHLLPHAQRRLLLAEGLAIGGVLLGKLRQFGLNGVSRLHVALIVWRECRGLRLAGVANVLQGGVELGIGCYVLLEDVILGLIHRLMPHLRRFLALRLVLRMKVWEGLIGLGGFWLRVFLIVHPINYNKKQNNRLSAQTYAWFLPTLWDLGGKFESKSDLIKGPRQFQSSKPKDTQYFPLRLCCTRQRI